MNVIWKDVKGFEGVYQISNTGYLKSFKQDTNGKVLKQTNKNGWYFTVNLCTKEKKKTSKIHRLVAEHFIPNPQNKPQVNHIDGNKQNNSVENLEWVTSKENIYHSINTGLANTQPMFDYNRIVRPKKIHQFDLSNNFIAKYDNAKIASNETNVCSRNILQVCSQQEGRKQAGGYIWKFESEVVL